MMRQYLDKYINLVIYLYRFPEAFLLPATRLRRVDDREGMGRARDLTFQLQTIQWAVENHERYS